VANGLAWGERQRLSPGDHPAEAESNEESGAGPCKDLRRKVREECDWEDRDENKLSCHERERNPEQAVVQVKNLESQTVFCSGWWEKEKSHPLERLETLQAVPAVCQKQPLLVRNWTVHEGRNRKPRDTKAGEQPKRVKSNVLAGCPWVDDGTVPPCHWTVDGKLLWWCEKCAKMRRVETKWKRWIECHSQR
jgi:hypothetical protein